MKKQILNSIILLSSFLVSCGGNKNPTQYKVFLVQPVYTEAASYTLMNEGETPIIPFAGYDDASILECAANNLAQLDNVTFENHIKDAPITKEVVQSFGENQIIFFQGHGDWMYGKNVIGIETGAMYDDEKYDSDPNYKADVDDGLIIPGWNEIITAKYITKYCGSLDNSIVYLGQCETCHEEYTYNDQDEIIGSEIDESLVNAFLEKGAAAVIANTHTIGMRYGNLLEFTTINLLGNINSQTGKKYTIGEALQEAKNTYGEKDINSGCESKLFGNANWRIE